MIKQRRSNHALLIAVFAGLPAVALLGWACPARAQYQVGGTGHALDANPQVGSGGINGGGSNSARINHNALNTDIVTGNVSSLNYFHGNNNGEFNPNVFAGRSATANSDHLNFVAGPTVSAGGVHVESSQSASPGITPVYSTQTYVGTPATGVGPTVVSPNGDLLIPAPRIDPLTRVDDIRDDTGHNLNSNPNTSEPMTIGELTAVNSVDASGNASIYTSYSPLYGVRQMQSGNPEDSFYQSKYGTTTVNPNGTALPSSAIQKMRDELNNNPIPADENGQAKPVSGAVPLGQTPLSNSVGNGGQSLPGAALDSSLNNQAVSGSISSGQGMQNEVRVAPAQQSAQLRALERRYAQSAEKLNDVQQTQRFNNELRAKAHSDTGTGSAVAPPPTGVLPPDGTNVAPPVKPDDIAPKPKAVLNGNDNPAVDNKPMIITSLATGMAAGGFSDLMKTAEEKMRQGKFPEAVASYESAEQVAKNNPFVYLGRAFAELGSSYYGKADLDIRRAVLIDPAVLSGRYDLNGFLGQDRVNFVQKELTDIAGREKKGARAYVLLAFVAHNTGDDALASTNLDEATARGGYAGLVDEMRKAWGIVSTTPPK